MSASNLVGGEYIDDWLFNFDPNLNPTLLSFAFVGGSAGSANNENTGVNDFQADGDGKFDIEFDFPPPPGDFPSKFSAGETSVYDITYISPITVSSFDFGSVNGGGNGTYKSAAHVQGIFDPDPAKPRDNTDGSGWIGPGNGTGQEVPEPAALLLLGGGLIGLAIYGRRKLAR
jgi:hypothetical protein